MTAGDSSALSHGEHIGRFQVAGTIGAGGMGVVYRAHDTIARREVALKTVTLRDAHLIARFRREVHALSRIDHPGVVRILDHGMHAGLPWYAMDLYPDRTLESVHRSLQPQRAERRDTSLAPTTHPTAHTDPGAPLATAPSHAAAGALSGGNGGAAHSSAVDVPRPSDRSLPRAAGGRLSDVLTLVHRLCAPLAFVHGEGIVHCDLKPENVFVRDDGSPVLADFGLVSHFSGAASRETLDVAATSAGTVLYMAPEQIRGEWLDARCDIYALGCMLYHLVGGQPPFVGAGMAVVRQHLQATPRPLVELVDGVPPALDDLVSAMLAKRPSDRIGFAEDVAIALEEVGARTVGRPGLPPPRPYLYRPELVGRRQLLERLLGPLQAAKSGQGSCLLVAGESGVGKTRFAMEVAARSGMEVITGECVAPGEARDGGRREGGPLHPLRPLMQAIADRCLEQGAAEARRVLGARAALFSLYEPAMAQFEDPAIEPPPAPRDEDEAKRRLFDALVETLGALTEARSLLLVLDDLQWADELTLELVRHLVAGALDGLGLLVLGTYRIEEPRPELQSLASRPGVTRVELGRLDAEGVGSMVGDMLSLGEPPASFVTFLSEQSEGNPFFVSEYLQTAVAERILFRDARGRWRLSASEESYASLPISGSLKEVIQLRLTDLTPLARETLETAAAIGRVFDGPVLQAATAATDTQALEAVAELRSRFVVEVTPEGRLRFVHDKLREISYDAVSDTRRGRLHDAVARAIEATVGRDGDAEHHAVLGDHWSRAAVPADASYHLRCAAGQYEAVFANDQAIRLYRDALRQVELQLAGVDDGALRWRRQAAELKESLGDLLVRRGQHGEARAVYPGTDDSALNPVSRARIARKIGKSWEVHHVHDEAQRAYERAATHLEEQPDAARDLGAWRAEWVQVRVDMIWMHYWQDQMQDMERCILELRPVVDTWGTARQRGGFFQSLTLFDLRSLRYRIGEETLANARRALDAHRESGDAGASAFAQFNFAFALLFASRVDDAVRELRAALEEAQHVGDVTLESRALTYLTLAHRLSRDVSATRRNANQTLEVAEAGRMMDYVGVAKANLGWVEWCSGDALGAAALCEAALDHWSGLALVFPLQWTALLPLFAISLEDADIDALVTLSRRLLDTEQQRLPDDLAGALGSVAAGVPHADTGRHGRHVVELAQSAGFL